MWNRGLIRWCNFFGGGESSADQVRTTKIPSRSRSIRLWNLLSAAEENWLNGFVSVYLYFNQILAESISGLSLSASVCLSLLSLFPSLCLNVCMPLCMCLSYSDCLLFVCLSLSGSLSISGCPALSVSVFLSVSLSLTHTYTLHTHPE